MHNSENHCVITQEQQADLPSDWTVFIARQTILLEPEIQGDCFFFTHKNLLQQTPPRFSTLLEQMSWVLLAHPECEAVIWPLLTSSNAKEPLAVKTPDRQTVNVILEHGYVCLSRATAVDLLKQLPQTILYFSHALLTSNNTLELSPRTSLRQRFKNKLTTKQKVCLRRQFNALKELLTVIRHCYGGKAPTLETSSSTQIIRHQLALNPDNTPVRDRIPILIAIHWLELGGAEKFAIELIKRLPKEEYAIYVTTDIPSLNDWSSEVVDHVEAIFHLPSFLPVHMMENFYEYLIRTRNIRLMHIHHAARAYESLFHIRRFHPQLQVIDTLHIIELPPNDGGYVESTTRHFEPFINHHHAATHHLKDFWMQRWQVPEDKISVIYLNVDSDHFDPDAVKPGQLRQKLNIPDNAILIGFLGRFHRQKQPLEFVKTAQILQQRWTETKQTAPLVFIMIGSGILEAEINKAIEKTPETTILLHPPTQNTLPVYKDCDILMMPSENEGLALVTYESMSMQTPIFFTNVGAQDELLQPEFLVENRKPMAKKFADAIWPYLVNSEKRQQTGVEMRNYILKHHRHEQTYLQFQALYQKLLEQ